VTSPDAPYSYYHGPVSSPADPPPSKGRSPRALAGALVFCFLAFCLLGAVLCLGKALGGSDDPSSLPLPAETASSTAAAAKPAKPAPPKVAVLHAGTYEVGKRTDPPGGLVAAGTYAVRSSADGVNCYWARLSDLSGDFTSINANGNLQPGATARITVKSSDAGFQLRGDCEARKVS